MKKLISMLLIAVLGITAIGCAKPQAALQTQTPATTLEPHAEMAEEAEHAYALPDFLWEIPENATDEEFAKLAGRNFKIVQSIAPVVEQASYQALFLANTHLRQKKDGAKQEFLTALDALVLTDPLEERLLFLWDRETMPVAGGRTYTEEQLDKAVLDGFGFVPFLIRFLADDPAQARGSIIVASGGNRTNDSEGFPAAEKFNELGYNVYVIQRRMAPYSAADSSMDMQRAIRLVRNEILMEGYGRDLVAALGFSAGGVAVLDVINHCYGALTPADTYAPDYVPDEIDGIESDLNIAMIVYGATDEGIHTDNPKLPSFYLCSGTKDNTGATPRTEALYEQVGHRAFSELNIIEGAGHGFGVGQEGALHSVPACAEWPQKADEMMDMYFQIAMTIPPQQDGTGW